MLVLLKEIEGNNLIRYKGLLNICIILLVFGFKAEAQEIKSFKTLKVIGSYEDKAEVQKSRPEYFINNYQVLSPGKSNIFDKPINLPPEVNLIFKSPNGAYSVGFYEGETPARSIYFMFNNGTVKETMVSAYPKISFSENGEYVAVHNSFGREIYIFNEFGVLVKEYDYIDNLVHDKQYPLRSVFVSGDGKIIVQTKDVYLFSLEGYMLWEKSSTSLLDVQFSPGKEKMLLVSTDKERHKAGHSRYKLEVCNLLNGECWEAIEDLQEVKFNKENILIKKNDKYYELRIK